eukprot:765909-Hanusia_phi.AAC.3
MVLNAPSAVSSDPMKAYEYQKMLSCFDDDKVRTGCSESDIGYAESTANIHLRQNYRLPSCSVGQYITSFNTCKNCSAQTFQASNYATTCQNCPTGKYSNVGASTCTTCKEGYMVNTSGSCIPCRPGTYLNITLGMCETCASGTYSRVEATTACFSCPSWHFPPSNATSTEYCKPCFPAMLYAELESNSCLRIPLGQLTVVIVGATSAFVILVILLLMLKRVPSRAQAQMMVAQSSSDLAYVPGPIGQWNHTSLISRQIVPDQFQMPTAPLARENPTQLHTLSQMEFQNFSDVTEPFRSTNYKTFRFARLVESETASRRVTLLTLCDVPGRYSRVHADLVRLSNLDRHDHVLNILGVSTALERELLLIVENLPMGTLDSLLQLSDKEEDETHTKNMLHMARQVCSGMYHLHSCGVIHGNLAAKHIHVESFDPTDYTKTVVKVGDYMLFEILRNADCLESASSDSMPSMSPIRWMAPEVLQSGLLSPQGDIWSFGVLLWEMWTDGELPYRALSDHEVKSSVLQEGSTLEYPQEGERSVNHIISGCWQVDALMRPSFECLEREFGTFVEK